MYRMMKEMGEDGQTIKVVEVILLKNFWEIYVIHSEEGELEEDELFTLTVGIATEMGSQWESEIKPHIITRTKDLHSVQPAPGWKWVGEDK